MDIEQGSFDNFIIVGDRVLIKPKELKHKTKAGLYLPPGVREKENIQSGYIIKTGPGYPIPSPVDYDEPWKEQEEKVQYIPLQAEEGDLAIYLQKNSFDIEYDSKKYVIVPQSAILLLIRDEGLFK